MLLAPLDSVVKPSFLHSLTVEVEPRSGGEAPCGTIGPRILLVAESRGSAAQLGQERRWHVALVEVTPPPQAHAHDPWKERVLDDAGHNRGNGFVQGDGHTNGQEQALWHGGR